MQFKVPQNIDIQDRILGPLTMVQFVYAVVGFGVCYVIFNAIPAPLSYFLMLPIALFVVCLDFVKINERPFLDFLKAALLYLSSPRERFWHQGDDTDLNIEVYKVEKKTATIQQKNISPNEIADLARRLDTGSVNQKR